MFFLTGHRLNHIASTGDIKKKKTYKKKTSTIDKLRKKCWVWGKKRRTRKTKIVHIKSTRFMTYGRQSKISIKIKNPGQNDIYSSWTIVMTFFIFQWTSFFYDVGTGVVFSPQIRLISVVVLKSGKNKKRNM